MSDQESNEPSRKNRFKSYIPAIAVGVTAGAITAIAAYQRFPMTNVTKIQMLPSGDVWLSEGMLQQIKDKGQGMFQIAETGQLVDMIDWAHPNCAHLSK